MGITRREFVECMGLFGIIFLITPGTVVKGETIPLRPPGALPEDDFNIKCIRCFKCGEVCPTGAINFGSWLDGQLADTPMLSNLRTNACNLCMECTKVCVTGALVPVEPDLSDIKEKVKIGTAVIDKDRCVVYNGRRCGICFRVCPLKGEAITLDKNGEPVIDEKYCVGCGLCEQACPVPVTAISVRRG